MARDVGGRRAFFVVGPAGSGKRLLMSALLAAGCWGDDGPAQRLDDLWFDGRPDVIAFWRSIPHGEGWPPVADIVQLMRDAGYAVTVLVTVRDPYAMARSQVQANHVAFLENAYAYIEQAYMYLFGQIAPLVVRLVMVPYEAMVLHRKTLALLLADLGLEMAGRRLPTIYDGNLWHYLAEDMGRLGFSGTTLEVLAKAGYYCLDDLGAASDGELMAVPGIGAGRVEIIRCVAGRARSAEARVPNRE